MRLSPSAVSIRPSEIDRAVKVQGAIRVDVNIKPLVVCRGIDQANLPRLHKVVGDDNMLLVWSDFDVMRADGRLNLVRVVKPLGVIEVRDIECCDVVARCDRRCGESD